MRKDQMLLTPFIREDCPDVTRILRDPRVAKTYMLPDLTREQADQLFLRLLSLSQAPGRYVRAVRKGDKVVGFLNDVQIDGSTMELGWAFHPDHWNRGYATQAVKKALEELSGLGYCRVIAGAFAENAPSIRVMEKCGMTRMDVTEQIEYRGKIHNCVYYGWEK